MKVFRGHRNYFGFLGSYYSPIRKEYEAYMTFTKGLPLLTKPGVFGLHDNADITKDQQETDTLLTYTLKTQVISFAKSI